MSDITLSVIPELSTDKSGIPLTVAEQSNYSKWLESQDTRTQAWLNNQNFSGKGLALIHSPNGTLEQALFFTDTSDPFCCGDLAKTLPANHYQLTPETNESLTETIALGWLLGSYEFSAFKTKNSETKLATLTIANPSNNARCAKLARAVYLTRDLINTPADSMMPQHLAQVIQGLAEEFGANFQQVVGDELLQNNYPTIHAVGRASEHEPRLLDLSWGDANAPKVTIVGKGVCFDSGGLDLKPSQAMRLMKKDMGGAAHAIGLALLVMSFNIPVRLRLLVPAVENAVSGNAFRPGDVIYTRKGISVEIDNTDAEGRLVLCDALVDACADQPDVIIDFATLTGAARVALGTELPAMFCNTPSVAEGISASGDRTGDPVWPLPLHKPYRSFLNSEVADMVNAASNPFGGAITAALFLQEFIEADTPWVHFDVMAWNNRKLPGRPVGGEAMGLRALFDYLENRFNAN